MWDHSAELTHPIGKSQPQHAAPRHPQPGRLSSYAIIGRDLPVSSSFVLARALTGATDAVSSLTPDRAAARNPAAAKKASTIQPDDHSEVTGAGQHASWQRRPPWVDDLRACA
jgi:hypothetical protein